MFFSRSVLRPPGPLLRKPHRRHFAKVRKERPTVIGTKLNLLPTTKLSTLYNGLRVVTEASSVSSHFVSIGICVAAGPRYETAHLLGASHLQLHLVDQPHPDRFPQRLSDAMASIGAAVEIILSRECIEYSALVLHRDLEQAIRLIAQTVRHGRMSNENLTSAVQGVVNDAFQWQYPSRLLPELVHQTAYGATGLGNRMFCPMGRLKRLRWVADDYRKVFYRSERMVFAAVGIAHGEAVRLAEKYFGDMERGPENSPSVAQVVAPPPPLKGVLERIPILRLLVRLFTSLPPPLSVPDIPAPNPFATTYTGGTLRQPHKFIHPRHIRGATTVVVAFQSPSLAHPDRPVILVLKKLLGGGSSFSAGGPGKGLSSRLYKSFLTPYGYMLENCEVFDAVYSDSGLFGAMASSSHPGVARLLFQMLVVQMTVLLQGVTADEVRRAKAMAKSAFLMETETKAGALKNLTKMVSAVGRKREMAREIDRVTLADVMRVAEMVFRGKMEGAGRPTVVALGRRPEIHRIGDGFVEEQMRRFNLGRYD